MTPRLEALFKRAAQARADLREDHVRAEIASARVADSRERLAQLDAKVTKLAKGKALLNSLVVDGRRDSLAKIEELVTAGLRAVFENDAYSFRIETKPLRDQVLYTFALDDGVHKSTDIVNERGGGVADVVSFILGVVVQLMLDPTARVFVLDERFKGVASVFRPNAALMLKKLAEQLNIQVIQVTHEEELAEGSDVVYRLTRDRNGVARVARRR